MLFEDILHPENLHRAWQRVRQNKGSAGIDGITNGRKPIGKTSGVDWNGAITAHNRSGA